MPRANDRRQTIHARRIFIAVVLLGLAWRALLALAVVPAWEARQGIAAAPDAYPTLAANLVDHGTLGYEPIGASPTTVRGPGFPLWLSIAVAAGVRQTAWLALWGGLPGIVAGAWLASIVSRRFGVLAAVAAAAVAVFHPLPSLISARAMGDDFYAATSFAALACGVLSLERRGRASQLLALVAGGLFGWTILARATGILALLPFAFVARRRPLLVAVVVTVALAPALGWSVRSSRLEGRTVVVHSLAGYNFWIGEALHRMGPGDPPTGNWGRAVEFAVLRAENAAPPGDRFWYATLTPRQAARFDGALTRAALDHVTHRPLDYAARVVRGLANFWVRAQTWTRTVQYSIAVVPVLLIAAVGARRAAGDPLGLALLLAALLHAAAYAASLPMARMSVQVYPALGWLVAAGVAVIVSSRRVVPPVYSIRGPGSHRRAGSSA